jgi:metal-responsive CopG/Arc/MetJ family transcriptional regulator
VIEMSKVMISILDKLLNLLDEVAKREHRTPSEFIRESVWNLS